MNNIAQTTNKYNNQNTNTTSNINQKSNSNDAFSKYSVKKEDQGLIIYQKFLELLYYSVNLVRKYPKNEQFALVQEIKSTVYSILKYLMYSIKSFYKQDKLKYLREVDVNLNLLKVQCRISYNLKYISSQNYKTWIEHITEICNMLGGWILSCQKR